MISVVVLLAAFDLLAPAWMGGVLWVVCGLLVATVFNRFVRSLVEAGS